MTRMRRELRILHVAPYFPPERIGGVGEVVAHVHRELLRRGHQSHVLTTGRDRSDPLIHRVATGPSGLVFAAVRHTRLARLADIVHMHHGESLGLLVGVKALGLDVPVLLTLHARAACLRRSMASFQIDGYRVRAETPATHRLFTMRVRDLLDRAALRLADHATFISKSTARDFLTPYQAEHATVIYNGLPQPNVHDAPNPEPIDLLYVGVYGVRKRVHVLPLVLAGVLTRRPQTRLRIIGFKDDDHPEFRSFAERVGVADALVFEGKLRSEEILQYYRAARVLLVPSAYEGLPMVILEALREGLPCVATQVSGHPEVIQHGRNGLLVDLDTPADMTHAVLRLLDDPPTADRMGAAGRALVNTRFTISRQVDHYIALYHQLLL